MTILSQLLAYLSLLFFILCILAPLKKSAVAAKYKIIGIALKHHTFYAVLILPLALAHGILAGKAPGMISGKIVWMLILILIITSIAGRILTQKCWLILHRILSLASGILMVIHICAAI